VDLICGCDWKLKELSILGKMYQGSLRVLPNALLKKFPLLETLRFDECYLLEALPENIGDLIHLKDITIYTAERIASIPPFLAQLTSLALYNCPALTLEGLAPLKQLQQLKILELGGVGSFIDDSLLPEWICDNITTGLLGLRLWNSVESLPSTISNFKHLTRLVLECSFIRQLPDSIGLLSLLQILDVSNRPECIPMRLPESFSQLATVTELDFAVHLDGIEPLQHLTGLINLSMRFHSEDSLQNLAILWNLTCLKSLILTDATDYVNDIGHQIEEVYSLSGISKLKNLERLYLHAIENVYELPDSIINLSCLTELRIWSMPDLESLPDSIGNLKGLKILDIKHCENLFEFPSSIGDLYSLEQLWIQACPITEIPDAIGKLNALKVLALTKCRELTAIPESFADRVLGKGYENWSLEDIFINNCDELVLSPRVEQAMEVLRSRGAHLYVKLASDCVEHDKVEPDL
jgi:hypothetical protein